MVPLVLATCALVAGCATNPVTGDQDFVLLSEEQEIALGRDYHEQILKQYDVYDDDGLSAYVSRVGQRLAQRSHRPDLDYTFTVLDDTAVNAFALPGGYVYITRGILAYFNSEAEMAGVLGHELGHVTARHSVQQYSAATASSILGTILLARAGAGRAGADLFQTVQLAAMRGYGRDQELQADRLGARYLARAGYDPDEMINVIGILADQEDYEVARAKEEGREPQVHHGAFATHPENDARLQEVVQAAHGHEVDDPRPAGHAAYLHRIDGLTFGADTKQGVVDGARFLHRDLDVALAAPDGWTIDNRPDRVIFRAPDDAAELVVGMKAVRSDASPRELLGERLGDDRIAEGRALADSRFPGYTGVGIRQTAGGQRRVRHVLVRKDEQAWYFAGIVPGGEHFTRYDADFLDIARGLHALTAAERRRARPLHIELVAAQAGDTYETLARAVPDRLDDPVARLRLINGDYPDGEPAAGRLIKTLR